MTNLNLRALFQHFSLLWGHQGPITHVTTWRLLWDFTRSSLAGELLCREEQCCRKTGWGCSICIKANSFKGEENGGNFFCRKSWKVQNLCSLCKKMQGCQVHDDLFLIPTYMIWQLKWDFFFKIMDGWKTENIFLNILNCTWVVYPLLKLLIGNVIQIIINKL